MKIFVINLEHAQVRRELISEQLTDLGLEFEVFPAVHLAFQTENNFVLPVSETESNRILRKSLSMGELGCALSHMSLYQRMVRDDIPEVLVLEDDAKCSSALPATLRKLAAIPKWEMVLLGHWSLNRNSMSLGAEISYFGRDRFLDRMIGKAAEFPLGAHAYVLKKSAAEKLLDYFCPVRMPADYVTGGAEKANVIVKLISPPVVTQMSTQSTIGPRLYREGARAQFQLTKSIKRLVRKFLLELRKIGVLRQSYIWVFNQRFK